MADVTATGSLDNDNNSITSFFAAQEHTGSWLQCLARRNRLWETTMGRICRVDRFNNPHIHPRWHEAWRAKESALKCRFARTIERLNEHSRSLPPLAVGDKTFIQNQAGTSPKKWDCSGTVVETRGNDQYLVKVDGSGRLTLRNRRFLRSFTQAHLEVISKTKHTDSMPPVVVPFAITDVPLNAGGSGLCHPSPMSTRTPKDLSKSAGEAPLRIESPPPLVSPVGLYDSTYVDCPTATRSSPSHDHTAVGNTIPPTRRPRRQIAPPPKTYVPETGVWSSGW